jgi:hypothetical protein
MTRTAPTPDATPDGGPEPERISGGHLAAKALKAEGIDTISTLRWAPSASGLRS